MLVVCPGIQLDWNRTEGLEDALGKDGVSSNYRFDLAPRTWEFIRTLRSGSAVFTVPSGAIKCAGAPQKIAYLAADYWRKQGVLKDIDVHLVMPGARPFGIPAIADSLDTVIADYGIHLHSSSEVMSVDAGGAEGRGQQCRRRWQRPHAALRHASRRAAAVGAGLDQIQPAVDRDAAGYVEVDKHTLQHVRYPNVFSLGDAGSTPNSKTGAAIRNRPPSWSTTSTRS